MTECYVSAKDYRQHWPVKVSVDPYVDVDQDINNYVKHVLKSPPPDRRIGPKDRRAPGHERRWEAARGRRRYLGTSDRRKA